MTKSTKRRGMGKQHDNKFCIMLFVGWLEKWRGRDPIIYTAIFLAAKKTEKKLNFKFTKIKLQIKESLVF